MDPYGYEAGKKVKGKKRHILVDTLGLLLHAIIHPADIQDRDGGILLLATLFGMYPLLKKLFADGGYQGRTFKRPWRRSCLSSKLKSSSAPIGRKGSWCFHAVGSSNAPLLGSTAAEGLPRIGRTSIATRWRFCGLPQSASCSENFVIPPDVFGQTLRPKAASRPARSPISRQIRRTTRRSTPRSISSAAFRRTRPTRRTPRRRSRTKVALSPTGTRPRSQRRS